MKNQKIVSRLNAVYLDIRPILVDLLQLVLSMYMSHVIMDNPFMGGATYLIFLCAKAAVSFINLSRRRKRPRRYLITAFMLLHMVSLIALLLWIIYPFITADISSIKINLLIGLLILRSVVPQYIGLKSIPSAKKMRLIHLLVNAGVLLPYSILCFFVMDLLSASISTVCYCIVAIVMWRVQYTNLHLRLDSVPGNALDGFSSYSVFMNMSLYFNIAIYLGVMLYLCYMCFLPGFRIATLYPAMICWALLFIASAVGAYFLTLRSGRAIQLSVFITGAIIWIIASYQMFLARSIFTVILLTFVWAVSFAATATALAQLSQEFRLLGQAVDREPEPAALARDSMFVKNIAFFISCFIMLLLLTAWNFVVPNYQEIDLAVHFRSWMILLPIVFMIISLFFALHQPLGKDNRQRVSTLLLQNGKNERMKNKLERELYAKTKVRFGTKILAAFLKLFLRHKVYGTENLDPSNFPAIFVCNHSHIYGPIAAVVYMPVYFRPWIDDRMINRELIVDHMYRGTFSKIPLLGRTQALAKLCAMPVIWALSSYDPIPVNRSDIRRIVRTMQQTTEAMLEGDNVLIFPENPSANTEDDYTEAGRGVGQFFTGFVQIAANYYKETGRAPSFYPVYANKLQKTFSIGKPVAYCPDNPKNEEKRRITDAVRNAMLELSTMK